MHAAPRSFISRPFISSRHELGTFKARLFPIKARVCICNGIRRGGSLRTVTEPVIPSTLATVPHRRARRIDAPCSKVFPLKKEQTSGEKVAGFKPPLQFL